MSAVRAELLRSNGGASGSGRVGSEQGADANVEGPNSWLREVIASLRVDMHPSHAGPRFAAGLRSHLNKLLMRYNSGLGGVVLAYFDEKLASKDIPLLPGINPYFRVQLTARVLLFTPVVGSRLAGKVMTVPADFIGLLVLGVFSSTIPADSIRPSLRFHSGAGCWQDQQDSFHQFTEASDVVFVASQVNVDDDFVHIMGSLTESQIGNITHAPLKLSHKAAAVRRQLPNINVANGDSGGHVAKVAKVKRQRTANGENSEILQTPAIEPSGVEHPSKKRRTAPI
eukprot:jgi/Chlat1/5088/Chrsp33S05112